MDPSLIATSIVSLAAGVGGTWLRLRSRKVTTAAKIEELYVNAINSLTESYRTEVARLNEKIDSYDRKIAEIREDYDARLQEMDTEVRRWRALHDTKEESHWALTEANRVLQEDLLTEKRKVEMQAKTILHLEREVQRLIDLNEQLEEATNRKN